MFEIIRRNITRVAKLLGLSFRTMQYRLDKFDIKRPNRGKVEAEEDTDESKSEQSAQ